MEKIAEIATEWKVQLFAAQLDLRQAFARVRHSAIFEAIKYKNMDGRITGAIAILLTKRHNFISLQEKASDKVRHDLGVPQGALEKHAKA